MHDIHAACVAAAALAGLAAGCLAHLLLVHLLRGMQLVYILAGSASVGILVVAATTLFGLPDSAPGVTVLSSLYLNLGSFAALFFSYFAFVNSHVSSLRVRILHELHNATEGLGENELLGQYNAAEIVKRRVARLISGQQIRECQGRLYVRPGFVLFIVRIISFCRSVLFVKDKVSA